MRQEFQVTVDYRQFYLWDPTIADQAPTEYTDEDVARRVKVAPSIVVVQPERDGDVAVSLEVHESDPGVVLSECDHVAECSIEVPGGRIQVHECLGSTAFELEVAPGTYAVRVCFHELASIAPDGLDGDDRYHLQLWPERERLLVVTKQWSAAGNPMS